MNSKKILFWLVGIVGLVLTVVPSILVYAGKIPLEQHKNLMLIGMLIWFISAPFFMNTPKGKSA